ncbi:hypothetical protein [Duganella sp. Root198D2]|uniref:hypothetical protein n=1 Tax=Duganella sp. Root198D2 TaxID=1736489 RepID=UPI00070A9703|nr:hypothetical protein [Duganella sp. Root198D2]KRB92578.1 hypothetical protein ASE26_06345 [Duganella sp. Root198D2]
MNYELFTFPKMPAQQSVCLLRPRRIEGAAMDLASKFAERFGVQARPQDMGARMIARDERSSLEYFVATGSVRYSTRPGQKSEAEYQPRLPDEKEAIDLAMKRLRELDLMHSSAAVHSVTDLEYSFRKAGDKEETVFPIARQVNMRFKEAGLPCFGPGAKIQVALGEGGNMDELLRFWREVDVAGEAITLSPDHLTDILMRDESFAQLRAGEASVQFHDCQVGFYALPPREVQGMIVPVFALSGTVSTPALPRYDFMRYVPAVSVETKSRAGMTELRAMAAY